MTTERTTFEILLAEDNPADVRLVREALREHRVDCTLHIMRDGAEAIAFVENLDKEVSVRRLDLVLVDLHLPKRAGDEILDTLRSTPPYARTPVVVMTASESPRDQEKAQKHAAVYYFQKPSELDAFMQLGAMVRAILTGGKEGSRQTWA